MSRRKNPFPICRNRRTATLFSGLGFSLFFCLFISLYSLDLPIINALPESTETCLVFHVSALEKQTEHISALSQNRTGEFFAFKTRLTAHKLDISPRYFAVFTCTENTASPGFLLDADLTPKHVEYILKYDLLNLGKTPCKTRTDFPGRQVLCAGNSPNRTAIVFEEAKPILFGAENDLTRLLKKQGPAPQNKLFALLPETFLWCGVIAVSDTSAHTLFSPEIRRIAFSVNYETGAHAPFRAVLLFLPTEGADTAKLRQDLQSFIQGIYRNAALQHGEIPLDLQQAFRVDEANPLPCLRETLTPELFRDFQTLFQAEMQRLIP